MIIYAATPLPTPSILEEHSSTYSPISPTLILTLAWSFWIRWILAMSTYEYGSAPKIYRSLIYPPPAIIRPGSPHQFSPLSSNGLCWIISAILHYHKYSHEYSQLLLGRWINYLAPTPQCHGQHLTIPCWQLCHSLARGWPLSWPQPPLLQPLYRCLIPPPQYFGVYVENFCTLTQYITNFRSQTCRHLFHCINLYFRPNHVANHTQ